jgi:hypothetical protein
MLLVTSISADRLGTEYSSEAFSAHTLVASRYIINIIIY